MKRLFLLAVLLALTVAAGAGAAPADTPARGDVVAFSASVRVDVDASGTPVKVEVPPDLPEAIRAVIEQRVRSWQYRPARIDGVPQAATTYVAVDACAVPIAGGYRLGVDFDGNGLRVAGDKRLPPPLYPGRALRSGTEADFVLILGIAADGRAVIDEIEKVDVSGHAGRNDFEPQLRQWARTLRFDPELLAGRPVAGRVRVPVSFTIHRDGDRPTKEEWQAKARTSRECQLAAGGGDLKPVALQPAVTVTTTPAG